MNFKSIASVVSYVFLTLAGGISISALVGFAMGDPGDSLRAMWTAALINAGIGVVLRAVSWGRHEVLIRDAILITVISWLALGAMGGLPFYLCPAHGLSVTDSIFESVSGFTTTGASVVAAPEDWPRGLLFWRATTHFIGGMGVLVLCVAILPLLGGGGMQMFRAEMPGPFKDRLTPRITDTARILWLVYALLTAACALALRLAGMNWFDAVCHAFAALATGGFSTRNTSIAAYNSLPIEMVLVVFMFLGAVNFGLYYAVLSGRNLRAFYRDTEFKFYTGFVLLMTGLIAFDLFFEQGTSPWAALRAGVFSVVSITTTTGFSTDDFDRWPLFSKSLLLLAMVFGGCSGSTAGAIKQFRMCVAMKDFRMKIKAFFNPMAVLKVKMNDASVPPAIVAGIVSFVALYLVFVVAASLVMTLFVGDGVTAFSSVLATTGCVGPGLNQVGPLLNYAFIPDPGKWVLILCMLLGRLEFLAILALFLPSFWRR